MPPSSVGAEAKTLILRFVITVGQKGFLPNECVKMRSATVSAGRRRCLDVTALLVWLTSAAVLLALVAASNRASVPVAVEVDSATDKASQVAASVKRLTDQTKSMLVEGHQRLIDVTAMVNSTTAHLPQSGGASFASLRAKLLRNLNILRQSLGGAEVFLSHAAEEEAASIADEWFEKAAKRKRRWWMERAGRGADQEADALPGPPNVLDPKHDTTTTWAERSRVVRDEFLHSWRGYVQHAAGYDELLPLSRLGRNWHDGSTGHPNRTAQGSSRISPTTLLVTVFDALSTMVLMNASSSIDEALGLLREAQEHLEEGPPVDVKTFEAVIRIIGGGVSFVELVRSGQFVPLVNETAVKVVVSIVKHLGAKLGRAFATPRGLPHPYVNLRRGNHSFRADGVQRHGQSPRDACVPLSEAGSVQLEYLSLAAVVEGLDGTGNDDTAATEYANAFRRIAQRSHTTILEHGCTHKSVTDPQWLSADVGGSGRSRHHTHRSVLLCPLMVNVSDGHMCTPDLSVGALGDSFFEYLLKLHILSDEHDPVALTAFLSSVDGLLGTLFAKVGGAVFVGSTDHRAVVADEGASSSAGPEGEQDDDIRALKAARKSSRNSKRRIADSESPEVALQIQLKEGDAAHTTNRGLPVERPGIQLGFMPSLQHLSCFLPGTMALAIRRGFVATARVDVWQHAASDLLETCISIYDKQRTGLGPDSVDFDVEGGGAMINTEGQAFHILRPEVMESLFYMWRLTRNESYRMAAWRMVRRWRHFCRVASGGYTGIMQVNADRPEPTDLQESFWLAETLKYAFLIFSEDSALDIDRGGWVLNTEAHPLRVSSKKVLRRSAPV